MRSHAHRRQDRDIDLGMTEKPEQVLPEKWRATTVLHRTAADNQPAGHKEAGSSMAITEQHDRSYEEYAERQQAEDRGHKPRPAGEGHAHHVHARSALTQGGSNKIDRTQHRAQTEQSYARQPEVCSCSLSGS